MKTDCHQHCSVRRIAILSDTHGQLLPTVLAGLDSAELIVHAGDVGSAEVLTSLASIAPVYAVRGNNDTSARWPSADADRLAALPESIELKLAGGTLVVIHGHQWPRAASRHAALRKRWPQVNCVVYGHSHRRALDLSQRPWIINPGAAGRARAYGGAGWVGLEISQQGWQCAESAFP